jgi:dihydroorotase
MDKISINYPLDMHLHLRDGDMLKLVAPLSSKIFAGAIVMPNIIPPVTTKEDVIAYKKRVIQAVGDDQFQPLMTVFYDKNLNVKKLIELKDHITAVKYYPQGATTNSDGGLALIDIEAMRPVLEKLQEFEIPLLFHGETNGFVMDREYEFHNVWESLAKAFPKLKIMMEHISDRRTLELLDKYDNLYATVTVHHLLYTLDDVIGGMLEPHMFCKPIIKTPADRDAIQKAVLNGHPKIMFGSDSAPHPKANKEKTGGSAGIFTAPQTLQILAEFFKKHGKLDLLQSFVSDNACKIYNLQPYDKVITLVKKDCKVPKTYDGYGETIVPMYTGQTLKWSIEEG